MHANRSAARGLARWTVLILLSLAAAGCSLPRAQAAVPNSHCANLVAQAVTSYFNIDGAGQCVRATNGQTLADRDLANFTAYPPPVFDLIDQACGYHPRDHTFNYLVSNATDGAAGRIIVLVDPASGWVRDVAKRLDRAPYSARQVTCPPASASYSFGS